MAKATVASTSEALKIVQKLVDTHDKLLIRGNGEPSLMEEVRAIKRFIDGIRFWMTAIGLSFIAQFVGMIWYFTTHVYPLMLQLEKGLK